jgi:hypothetical protein
MAAAPAGLAGAIAGAALSGAAAAAGTGTVVATTFLMKTSTAVAAAVLVAGALGVAFFQTSQARRAGHDLAALARERDGLAARLRTAEELGAREKQRALVAEQQTEQVRNETARAVAAAARPATSTSAPVVAAGRGVPGGWGFTPSSGDPAEQKRRVRESNLQSRYTNYQALFHALGFTASQREQFRALIAADIDHAEEVLQATMTRASAETNGDRAAMQKVFEATNAQLATEFQAAVRANFGEEAALALVRHQETTPVRALVADLSQQLFYSESPLSVAQATQLVDILGRAARNPQGRVDLSLLTPDTLTALTQGVISPAQIPAFRSALQSTQARIVGGR